MSQNSSLLDQHYKKTDQMMLGVLWLMFLYACGLALWHGTWGQALLIGGGTSLCMTVLYALIAGQRLYRCAIAAAFMVMAALHINQSSGLLETHFGIFVLLAFLLSYRDWLPIVIGAAVIALHHLAFFALQQQGAGVIVVPHGSWGTIFLHAFYVVLETAILIYLANIASRQAREGNSMVEATERLIGNDEIINLAYRCQAGESSRIGQRFNRFLDQLEQVIRGAVHNMQALLKTGNELRFAAQQARDGASTQQHEIQHMTGAMQQMVQAIDEVAHHADTAASNAQAIDHQARDGSAAIEQALQAIHTLASHIDSTQQDVKSLAEQTQLIGKVLDVIGGIAGQTNLLALNAAIEAARAGEQGRGFAVVADEVRNLAQKTAASTAEIQTIISALQRSSDQVVSAMDESQKNVQGCVGNTQRTAALLAEMASEINSICHLNELIASATNEQSAVSNDVSERLDKVLQIAQDSASAAEALHHSSASISQLATALGDVSQRFITR